MPEKKKLEMTNTEEPDIPTADDIAAVLREIGWLRSAGYVRVWASETKRAIEASNRHHSEMAMMAEKLYALQGRKDRPFDMCGKASAESDG